MAATGRCLCGAVRFEVEGELRDVVVCHCGECRRWAGHVWAATSCLRDALRITGEGSLRWIDSPESETHARRGFCTECGSSLFWDAPGRDTISIAAGALEPPTGLKTVREISGGLSPPFAGRFAAVYPPDTRRRLLPGAGPPQRRMSRNARGLGPATK
jgi:hypothetical protein